MRTALRVLISLLFLPLLCACRQWDMVQFFLNTPDGEIVSSASIPVFRVEEGKIETHVSFPGSHSLSIQFMQGEITKVFFGDTFHSKSYSSTESYTGTVRIKQQDGSCLILHFSDLRFSLPSGQYTLNGDLKYSRNDEYWLN